MTIATGEVRRCPRARDRSAGSASSWNFARKRVPIDEIDPSFRGFLELENGRAQRGITESPALAARGGVRQRRAGWGVSGQTSRMIWAICSSLSRSASSSGETLGELPAPGERQQMALLLADDLGPRMGGRDIRAGRGREPINQAIETSVVVGLQDDGVVAEEHFAENQGFPRV